MILSHKLLIKHSLKNNINTETITKNYIKVFETATNFQQNLKIS